MRSTSVKRHLITVLVRQAHQPRGLLGSLEGLLFAHRPSNRQRNRWVVDLLDVRPTDRVLEVGFGPGLAIGWLARRAMRGRVYGIDHSEVMVRQASRRNATAIRAGRVELIRTSVTALPAFDEPLDAILAVNTVGMWPDPVRQLTELRGLLRPGGRIALVSQPRCPGATAETTTRAGRELTDQLDRAGFTDARPETLALDPPVACVLAVNPLRQTSDVDGPEPA